MTHLASDFIPPTLSIGKAPLVASAEAIPDRIGEYEILAEIARGGMGVVYKARHRGLGRIAAIKLIKAGEFADADAIRRFQQEAAAASRLDHPNIVPLFEVGEHGGRHFMALAFIDGMSLSERLRSSPLAPQEAALLLIQISRAIHFAHERGIVHRDIKPHNILVSADDIPKVTDFGLAKSVQSDSDLTRTGAIIGTPSYMPPEQAMGNHSLVGVTSDVYSLGATLYTVLTGRAPFMAATPLETLKQVLDCEPISPRVLNPGVPGDLEAICLKALEKPPARRYQSAKLLAEDLERFARGEPTVARPMGAVEKAWRWGNRNRLLAGAVSAVSASLLIGAIVAGVLAILANGYANQAQVEAKQTKIERDRAREERDKADEQKEKAERQLYFTTIAREEARMKAGNVGQALDRLRTIPRVQRSWEHRFLTRVAEGSPLTFRGHRNSVTAVSFTPDGEQLISGSYDGTIRVWDVRTGQQQLAIEAHPTGIKTLAISPDGSWLVSGSNDNTIKFWDLPSGALKRTIAAHDRFVYSVAISPDGKRIVSGGGDQLVKVWEASTGKLLHSLAGHKTFVPAVAFSIDGLLIASYARQEGVKIWDANTGQDLRTLIGEDRVKDEISGLAPLAFSPDGGRLAVGWEFGVDVWNHHTGEKIHTHLKSFDSSALVSCVSFSPDGIHLACGTNDGNSRAAKITIFDSRFGNVLRVLRGHQHDIKALATNPEATLLASAGADGIINLWDLRHGSNPRTFVTAQKDGQIALSKSGDWLVGRDGPDAIKLWNAKTGVELQRLECHQAFYSGFDFSPDDRLIVSSSSSADFATVWELPSGKMKCSLGGAPHKVVCVAFSPKEAMVATGGTDGAVKLWDPDSGKELKVLRRTEAMILCLAFSPDGKWIAAGSNDRMLHVWDVQTGKTLVAIEAFESRGYYDWISALAFHPRGRLLAVGNQHGRVRILNAANGELVRSLIGHDGRVKDLRFSPDGRRIFMAGGSQSLDRGVIRVWDVASGSELLVIDAHEVSANGIAVSTDGKQIFSTGNDGLIKIWDARTPAEILSFHPHPSEVSAVTLDAKGSRLATGTYNGVIKIWHAEDATELLLIRSGLSAIVKLAFDDTANMLYSQDIRGNEAYWDLLARKKLPGQPASVAFETYPSVNDGKLQAYPEGESAILIAKSEATYEPWKEFFDWKDAWQSVWQADDARRAREVNDWFANQFYLARNIGGGDHYAPSLAPPFAISSNTEEPPPMLQEPFNAYSAHRSQEAWAKFLKIPVEKTNSLGMVFRLIPPGEYTMGLPGEYAESIAMLAPDNAHWQQNSRSSSPPHRLRITRPFYLATCETTQQQYEQVMGDNPSAHAATGSKASRMNGIDTRRHPVEMVGFGDAAEFCIRLAKSEGQTPFYVKSGDGIKLAEGTGYRLPSEAEWEWACGAGTTTASHSGRLDSLLGTVAFFNVNSGGATQAVGQLRPNAFGIHDMHGNVWERCQDGFDPSAYATRSSPLTDDPVTAISSAACVVRGGSWFDSAAGCRTSQRFSFLADQKLPNCGFRVALSVPFED